MTNHIMIDTETLGTNNDSQILSIGACLFNSEGEVLDSFYRVIKLKPNEHVKATPSTLQFWVGQGSEAFNELLEDPYSEPVEMLLSNLSAWVEKYKEDLCVWANGTKFDLSMLDRLYSSLDMYPPWKYNSDRCMRTIRYFAKSLNLDVKVNFEGRSHHALDDATWQAKYVAEACKKLNLPL